MAGSGCDESEWKGPANGLEGWATFGFGATVALTAVLVACQLAGLTRMDIPMMLGTVSIEDPDKARVLGSLVHLINGQGFALIYGSAFAALGEATWWLGALFGGLHGFAAMTLIVPLLPGIHPRMASDRSGLLLGTCWSRRACST